MRLISRGVAALLSVAAGIAAPRAAGGTDSVLCKSLTTPPGAIYLFGDGPTDTTFMGNDSFVIDGKDYNLDGTLESGSTAVPGIATRTEANTLEVIAALGAGSGNNLDNVQGLGYQAGPPAIPSVRPEPGPSEAMIAQFVGDLLNMPGVNTFAISAINNSNKTTFTSPVCGIGCCANGANIPKISHFTASDLTIKMNGNISGCGIMIVEGNLDIEGSIDFAGLILVRGGTTISEDSELGIQGNATILGSLWTLNLTFGFGGNAVVKYSSDALAFVEAVASSSCQPSVCGDGVVTYDEQCDDDGGCCSATCTIEDPCITTTSTSTTSTTTTTNTSTTSTTMTTSSTTTSTTSTTLLGCGPSPRLGCILPANGKVTIKESIPGHERLKVALKGLVSRVSQRQLGNPTTGTTRYDVCLYDDALRLVTDLTVDRAAQVCGNPPKVCWLPISDKGYRYADRDASAGGVQKITAKGGSPGRGNVVVKAGNNSAQGQVAMPVGITAALEGTQSVTMQILTSDGDCFGATLAEIRTAKSYSFQASGSPIPLPTTTITTSTTSTTVSGCTFLAKWGTAGSGDGQFISPLGVATDASGNVYVVDSGNNRIQKFDASGTFLTKWGTAGSGDGQFESPTFVAISATGDIYVVDNNRIQKFDATGTFLTKWGTVGSGDGQFNGPWGVATDASGNVYVGDAVNNRVQKFDAAGAFLTKWGTAGSGDGQFISTLGVATDASGNVYVADNGNTRIQKFDASGTFLTKLGTFGSGDAQFRVPNGVATDASGNVYVVDTLIQRIQKFDASGAFLTKWGTFGSGDGQFNEPVGVATGGGGDVYVTDTQNQRIQRFGLCP